MMSYAIPEPVDQNPSGFDPTGDWCLTLGGVHYMSGASSSCLRIGYEYFDLITYYGQAARVRVESRLTFAINRVELFIYVVAIAAGATPPEDVPASYWNNTFNQLSPKGLTARYGYDASHPPPDYPFDCGSILLPRRAYFADCEALPVEIDVQGTPE